MNKESNIQNYFSESIMGDLIAVFASLKKVLIGSEFVQSWKQEYQGQTGKTAYTHLTECRKESCPSEMLNFPFVQEVLTAGALDPQSLALNCWA